MAVTNMALSTRLKKIQPTSPQHAAAIQAVQDRINAALVNGNTGPKGFLQWVKAAWPAPIAAKILAAAKKHQQAAMQAASTGAIAQMNAAAKAGTIGALGRYDGPTTFGRVGAIYPRPTRGSRALTWAGRQRRSGIGAYADPAAVLSGLGQTSSGVGASTALGPITIAPATDTGSSTIASSSTASASPSWLSSIGTAVTSAVQGYLGIQQAKDAQTLFDTNLARAQQGLAPLNSNPSAYGIVNPQVNVGLASSTQSLIMYAAIGAGVLGVLYIAVHATKK